MINVHAIIVTHNRKALLIKCLQALSLQTRPPDHYIVVDNASTDGTEEWLYRTGWADAKPMSYLRMKENVGASAGFLEGMQHAFTRGADWVWMMDDDAEPQAEALNQLLLAVKSDDTIYGSIATTTDGRLCWPLVSNEKYIFHTPSNVPEQVQVTALPFLGLLISKLTVNNIGYPDPGYFIAGDDTEYCFRARRHGIAIIAIGNSIINHPPSRYYRFGLPGLAPFCFKMTPWKRYYDVRNRILTMRRAGLFHVLMKTMPGTMLRLIATLINEPQPLFQLWAYIAGAVDGMRGLKGARHKVWHLRS